MPELATVTRSAVDIAAGRRTHPTAQNRVRVAVIDSASVYTAANADTFATGLVLPKGSRLLAPVTLSNAAGAASSTLSLGLRNALTKEVIDATAIIAAAALTSAQQVQLNTGTKMINGQYYVLPVDCEIFGTFGGATPTANQAFRVEVSYDWA